MIIESYEYDEQSSLNSNKNSYTPISGLSKGNSVIVETSRVQTLTNTPKKQGES